MSGVTQSPTFSQRFNDQAKTAAGRIAENASSPWGRRLISVIFLALMLCVAIGIGYTGKMVFTADSKDGVLSAKITRSQEHMIQMSVILVWFPILYFIVRMGGHILGKQITTF